MSRRMLALCLGLSLAACGGSETNDQATTNEAAVNTATAQAQSRTDIAEALGQSSDHSSFMQAIETAGLTQTLRGVGPYTVFAPNNAAFAAIPAETREGLNSVAQRERLIALLSYHIVPGTVTAQDIGRAIDSGQGGRAELATVAGDNITLSRDGDALVVTDGSGARARIAQADQLHSNGVVHGIDAVLMPATE
ncbi:MAG TPA: fasciclin domain-containing protein [Allosphingosinicella sp.]|nr:fasciclin domain-containing protein [Allosphingosinicella sp.]